MPDRRMSAYYYSFEPTGVDAVDVVLSAVACAGKAFHHTQEWNNLEEHPDLEPYESEHRGKTPKEWIQNAAADAADAFRALGVDAKSLSKKRKAVHLRGGTLNGCSAPDVSVSTRNARDVTCKCCVFELLVQGAIGPDDHRVTAPMLEHKRFLGRS